MDVAVVPSFCSGSDHRLLRAKVRFNHKLEKNICHSSRNKNDVVYDDMLLEESLSRYDWPVAEDLTEDYGMLLKGLVACAERALKPCSTHHLDRISNATKELLRRRRALRLDPNASNVERLVANISCRRALQEDLRRYRQERILEAAQRRLSLRKCRRDLQDYRIRL